MLFNRRFSTFRIIRMMSDFVRLGIMILNFFNFNCLWMGNDASEASLLMLFTILLRTIGALLFSSIWSSIVVITTLWSWTIFRLFEGGSSILQSSHMKCLLPGMQHSWTPFDPHVWHRTSKYSPFLLKQFLRPFGMPQCSAAHSSGPALCYNKSRKNTSFKTIWHCHRIDQLPVQNCRMNLMHPLPIWHH